MIFRRDCSGIPLNIFVNSILIARHRAMLKEDGQEAKAICIKGLVKKNSKAMETSAVKTRKIGTSIDWLRRSRGTYRFFLGLSQGFLALFPFSQSLDKDKSTPRSFIPFLLMISYPLAFVLQLFISWYPPLPLIHSHGLLVHASCFCCLAYPFSDHGHPHS